MALSFQSFVNLIPLLWPLYPQPPTPFQHRWVHIQLTFHLSLYSFLDSNNEFSKITSWFCFTHFQLLSVYFLFPVSFCNAFCHFICFMLHCITCYPPPSIPLHLKMCLSPWLASNIKSLTWNVNSLFHSTDAAWSAISSNFCFHFKWKNQQRAMVISK